MNDNPYFLSGILTTVLMTAGFTCIVCWLVARMRSKKQATPSAQIDAPGQLQSEVADLRHTVFDLLMEIEAIRTTLLRSPLGEGGRHSPYAIAYRETALLTHNSTGCTGGEQKLAGLFYSFEKALRMPDLRGGQTEEWRECLLMKRMGYSAAELSSYQGDAREAETYT